MTSIWFYRWMSRARWLSYRAKIMAMAFLGTHIPLIALSVYFAFRGAATWAEVLYVLGVTLAATLAGTAVTLFVLDHLLRPVVNTALALRRYGRDRTVPDLPTGYEDEAGTLMGDAQRTMTDLESSLRQLERQDEATGLLNRRAFLDLPGEATALAVLRLANFDAIAQSLDRATATEALRRVAARLAERLGPDARLARVGDGDLAFRLPAGPLGAEEDGKALRGLVARLGAVLDLDGVSVTPTIVAATAPLTPGEAGRALDDAVAAAALAHEGAPVASHSPAARERLRDGFLMEQELRAALRNGELVLHYQPVMDLASSRFVGAEALIRWNSPRRGLVPPGAFIPVAEASGLIGPIGLWVLQEACREASTWTGGQRVAVNLGASQFMDEDLGWHVAEAAGAAGLATDRLEIELTESTAMADHAHTRRAFGRLRDMGVQIAIDDFGTGYASMSTLRKLPFHKLKIDREFVSEVHRNGTTQAICGAMIALGQGLGLDVLAEGTETEEEVAWISGRGCRLFQGYYFSRPVVAAQLPADFRAADGELLRVG
jgi:EAL domain-containing protein (putative c-di-GMP-specific phosphodiesterase class I)/GGDEF domain-containing protein